MIRAALTYLRLAVGAFGVAMGIVCLTFGLLMIFGGESKGLMGLVLAAMNFYMGARIINDFE